MGRLLPGCKIDELKNKTTPPPEPTAVNSFSRHECTFEFTRVSVQLAFLTSACICLTAFQVSYCKQFLLPLPTH